MTRTRLAYVALLAAAGTFLVFALAQSTSGGDGGAVNDPAIVSQLPNPGGRVLRQSQVGAELEPGYDGRLSINGIAVPEEQLVGAIPPDAPEFDPDLGVRPNNKNSVVFKPGPGKVLDKLPTGEVRITLRFWRTSEGEASARTATWTFFVT